MTRRQVTKRQAETHRVGFVGLGTMGAAMAANLARALFPQRLEPHPRAGTGAPWSSGQSKQTARPPWHGPVKWSSPV